MHDPLTLAFQIKAPWKDRWGRPSLIDIWHKDPERDGSDDSCDWSGFHRPLNVYEKALRHAIWDAESVFGNEPFYGAELGSSLARGHDAFRAIQEARREWAHRHGFRIHPRWHVHHWRIRVWPVIHGYRFLFLRCSLCHGRIWPHDGLVSDWGGGNVHHLRHDMAKADR